MQVDAIVNAANETLLGGGGVDGSIHRAAGPELLKECITLGGCEPGSKITRATTAANMSSTPSDRAGVVVTVEARTAHLLLQIFLELAKDYECETVAFPLISSGIFGYPKDQALRIAVDTISDFLLMNDMTIYIVIFDRKSYQISESCSPTSPNHR